MSNPKGRPLKYIQDPIIRMRAYVRKSIKEKIEAAARINKVTPGQVIDHQFQGLITRVPPQKNKPTEEDEVL